MQVVHCKLCHHAQGAPVLNCSVNFIPCSDVQEMFRRCSKHGVEHPLDLSRPNPATITTTLHDNRCCLTVAETRHGHGVWQPWLPRAGVRGPCQELDATSEYCCRSVVPSPVFVANALCLLALRVTRRCCGGYNTKLQERSATRPTVQPSRIVVVCDLEQCDALWCT
jgi:hypothetical protein